VTTGVRSNISAAIAVRAGPCAVTAASGIGRSLADDSTGETLDRGGPGLGGEALGEVS
jgi:hypothetical protein